MIVEFANRRVANSRRVVTIDISHPGRLISKPSLVRSNLARLRGAHSAEVLLALPTLPGKFVIVPHADERPTRARILQIGIEEIALVQSAIIVNSGGHVKIADLFTVGV